MPTTTAELLRTPDDAGDDAELPRASDGPATTAELPRASATTGRRRAAQIAEAFVWSCLAAAGVAAALRAAQPFDHGIWLVAYLFLVGFAAQLLLHRGEAALTAPHREADGGAGVTARTALWAVGVVAVPFGVFAGTRLAVLVGSIALWAALTSFALAVHRNREGQQADRGRLRLAYGVLVAFMALSALVGLALAWYLPWL